MRVLVTAGPTREPLDPVRFLSNRSSGKMGYALAEAALELEHDVVLISGPVAIEAPKQTRVIRIATGEELFEAVHEHVKDCDVLVMCAAVADYKPTSPSAQKIPKNKEPFALPLTPTRDILASLPIEGREFFVVGFAAETQELETNAQRKLRAKNCDMIVANDVSARDLGMESDDNAVTIFFRDGSSQALSRAPKKILARAIMKIILEAHEKSLTKKT